jgi:putative hydroxymethylpyrimidine transport system substrate-binding protein
MAYQRGYFDDVGLRVWIRTPAGRTRPVRYVAEREVALAVSHQPEVALAQGKGVPVTSFGSLIQRPTAAMIWLRKSQIDGIADLKGKTIALTGLSFEKSFLEALLARAGLTLDDVKVTVADYDLVPTLVRGDADAIFGSWNVEGEELKAQGKKPVITKVESLGAPSYDELVLIARPDRLAADPQLIEDFMSALARGTAAAVKDPKAATRTIEHSIGANPDLDPKATKAAVDATLPLLSRDAYMDPGQAERLLGWMQEEGMLQQAPPVAELLTNELLSRSGG